MISMVRKIYRVVDRHSAYHPKRRVSATKKKSMRASVVETCSTKIDVLA